jgi:hypothetical protein
VSAPPSPAPTKLAASVRLGAHRSRVGGARADASSTRPVLAGLISRAPGPFNGALPSPETPALDLRHLASIDAPRRFLIREG